ncbi:hypothetical protein [uncultured Nostoc sp.]|uniref:hypothetical protein n=1 Tax=uncultured Nostoc sp. TaxID=340711 RepID=UPI0035CCA0A1
MNLGCAVNSIELGSRQGEVCQTHESTLTEAWQSLGVRFTATDIIKANKQNA